MTTTNQSQQRLEGLRLLSPEEAGIYMNVHADTIRRHIRAGNIEYLKIGKSIKVPRRFLDQMIEDRVKLSLPENDQGDASVTGGE